MLHFWAFLPYPELVGLENRQKKGKMTNVATAQKMIESGANQVRNLVCECELHCGKAFVKVSLIQFAQLADKMAIDLANEKQLRTFTCNILKKVA